MTEEEEQGWAFPTLTASKPHYFRAGRSLCGKYGSFLLPPSAFMPDTGETNPADCAPCARRLEASR